MRERALPRLADLIDEIADDEASSPEPLQTRRVNAVGAATFEALKGHTRRVG